MAISFQYLINGVIEEIIPATMCMYGTPKSKPEIINTMDFRIKLSAWTDSFQSTNELLYHYMTHGMKIVSNSNAMWG